jgi:hypothetical protein
LNRPLLRSSFTAAALATLLAPGLARAHFILQAPPSSTTQDILGSPQKLGPCGNESGGSPTGTVTAFHAGDSVAITIDEKITHPGHYRIALSVNDRSELPAEPTVTAGSTACGSVPIDPNPSFPVLADGVFKHTSAFSGPQTTHVTLPSNITCTHCTLQVIEFMSNHPLNNPGGCFYHHCADISISPGATNTDGGEVTPTDAGTEVATDGGESATDAGTGSSNGTGDQSVPRGGCASVGGVSAAALLALAAVTKRRGRRAL